MRNKKILFISILLFMVVLSIGAISAQDADDAIVSNSTTIVSNDTGHNFDGPGIVSNDTGINIDEPDVISYDSNSVSGGVDVVTVNPWNTTGELSYDIPSDARTIKSADVYVNVYGGSAKNTYGANADITITAGNRQMSYYELLWTEDGSSDGTVYTVNDDTTKCYSDYMIHYDITSLLNGLSGSNLNINVATSEIANMTFDGRIKLIALILAYDDGDDDSISYWINDEQLWSKSNVTVTFDTDDLGDFTNATLTNVVLSSGDGTYVMNDDFLGDADVHESGNYYQYNRWDVTDVVKSNQENNLNVIYAGTSAYGSIKNVLSVLTVNNLVLPKTVSGRVDVVTVNPWNTTGELVYEIPSDAMTIRSADVYVNVYAGNAKNNYGADAFVTITANGKENQYYESLWIEEGSSDGTVYTVNDHTTKCYSDYMIHYDITSMLNGAKGDLTIDVDTYQKDNMSFDGRIKLIALVLAYDDGDDDSISYWINDNQLWTKTNVTVTFDTDDLGDFTNATLTNVVLSSGDGTYMMNDDFLGDADVHESGNYYQYNEWDVTELVKSNQKNNLDVIYAGTSAWGSIKNVLSVLTVNNLVLPKTVSGRVDVVTVNPWNTTGELVYEIPSDAMTIRSADVYVNVYAGNAKNNYGADAFVTITANGKENQYYESLWIEEGSTDGTVYTVNDHTTKCYSDYMIHYDITSMLNGAKGDLTIDVDTFKMGNMSFDGRIKLIALVLAYDDGDDDSISYWINDNQLWTKTNVTVTFDTDDLGDFIDAKLNNVVLSSGDGTYMMNDDFLGDADVHESGNYYQYNEWDVTELVKSNQKNNLDVIYAGTSAYGSIKNVLSVLTVTNQIAPRTVSGGVDVVTVNPWNTTGELNYYIPSDAKEIKSADVYVNVYAGSAANTYGANAFVTITANGKDNQYYESLWIEEGSTDGTVYTVNDHATKCYSDYMIHYDITDMVEDLSDSNLKINVDTFKMDNKNFDGRIKLIALVLAYDDGDDDVITYWINDNQLWSKKNVTVTFGTEGVTNFIGATLTNVVLSSGDGTYMMNENDYLGDAAVHESGNYYQYNKWDVTDVVKANEENNLNVIYAGTSAYGSIKNALSVLAIYDLVIPQTVSGGVDVVTINPWNTTGELIYDIPSDARRIRGADVYVNVYGGSAANTYGADADITITAGDIEAFHSETLWTEEGSSDGTVYIVNDHITKCYSDYMVHYDITGMLEGLNGSNLKINVDTFKMDNKTFDGRIKLIALILAFDDGDDDSITYWINDNQLWSKKNVTVTFGTEGITGYTDATLTNVVLSSGDGTYMMNGEFLGDSDVHVSGNYYQYNEWDVTGFVNPNQETELNVIYAGTSAWGSIKNVLSVLTLNNTVLKNTVKLSASSITTTFKSGDDLVVTLNDAYDMPISDAQVEIILNGVTKTLTTDVNGQASLSIDGTAPGYYIADVTFYGDEIYAGSSTSADVTVLKADTIIVADDVYLTYKNTTGDLVATITNAHGKPLSVNLNVNFNGESYTIKSNSKGEIAIPIDVSAPGTYEATFSYAGNLNYNPTSAAADVIVEKADTVITANNVSVAYKDTTKELVATIKNVYGNCLGVNLNVNFNGENYTVKANSKGQISIPIGVLAPGTYEATISYAGNVNYNPSTTTANVVVEKADTVISVNDLIVAYQNPSGKLVATLTNAYGNGLGVNVNVNLNGENYTIKAASSGKIIIPTADLPVGTYVATIAYNGNANYNPSNATATIVVNKAKSQISAPETTTVAYKDPNGELLASLTSIYGYAISDNVTVSLNGKTYIVESVDGLFSVPTASLSPGSYVATISFKGNADYKASSATANVTVIKSDVVIVAPDVSIGYKDPNGQLVATITNEYGKPLSVNLNVNINGKDYTVKADSNGQISIPTAGLAPGSYVATISYKGNVNYNAVNTTANIVVTKSDAVITAPDVSVAYKNSTGEFVATVTNAYGKPLSVNVNVNFNGETYTVKTDSNGQISIPTAGLAPGSYAATISYAGNVNYNSASTTATVVVNKADTVITAQDVTVYSGDESGKLVATLKNAYGNGLGVNVNINIYGQDYVIRAASNGKIIFPTAGLAPGNYTATISYKGNANYNPSSTTANVVVLGMD